MAVTRFRQDVSEGLSWRDVMSLSKRDARTFGARAVKHTAERESIPMSEKAQILLAAEPEEFRQLQFNGIRGFRLPSGVLDAPF